MLTLMFNELISWPPPQRFRFPNGFFYRAEVTEKSVIVALETPTIFHHEI